MKQALATLVSRLGAAANRLDLKKLEWLSLALSLGLLFAAPSVAQKRADIWTGVPINLSTLTLHVGGKPITVYEFTLSIYPMNTPPPWPIGLWLYNYVEVDPDTPDNKLQSSWGQANWCRWWFFRVAALEINNKKQLPYPYFELNLPADPQQQILTHEQISVYPSGSVTCWQADNDYAP